MSNLLSDLRHAFRILRKAPGFTITTVLTLALGIGANSAIFSVVNALLLHPLPLADAGQLMALFARDAQGRQSYVSQPDFEDWRAQSQIFADMASYVPQSVNLTGLEEPTRVIGNFVSSSFFPVLGVAPAMGRGFLPGEDTPGAAHVVLVTYATWQGRFGGDPQFLGKKLILNGEPFTVVGILPKGFVFPPVDADVYIPAPYYPNYSRDRANTSCAPIGRLKPGVPVERAQAEMNTIAARLAAAYPATNKDRGILVVPLKELMVGQVRPIVIALFGAVAFVLLIGCANVVNLLMTRMIGRSRENAVRAALGASRARLVSQLFTETLLLGLAGGGLGLLLGLWGVEAIAASGAGYLPPGVRLTLDSAVLGFTLGLSLVAGLLVALIPALGVYRSDWNLVLREGRGGGASAGRNRARSALVVGEVALALVLLAGAGLMIRSFFEIERVSPGYDPQNLLTLEYRLPRNKYPGGAQQAGFHRQVVERVAALPGVVAAASVRALPFSGNGNMADFLPLDRPEPPASERPRALANIADPGYFRAMRIPLLQGRVFTERDQPDAPPVVLVNQTLARRYWPGENAVGKKIHFPGPYPVNVTAEVVGVVGGVKHFGLDDRETPQIYGPLAQYPFIFNALVVRTAGDPDQMANLVRKAIWSVDKDQPVWKVRSLESMIDTSVSPRRFVMLLLSLYAGLALLLAAVGIFGVISYAVGQRTAEIGIRVALGAEPRQVMAMILRQGLLMTLGGVAIGLAGAAVLTQLLESQLYAVSHTDPLVYASVAALLALVALAACWLPARRAMKVDPTVALRYE